MSLFIGIIIGFLVGYTGGALIPSPEREWVNLVSGIVGVIFTYLSYSNNSDVKKYEIIRSEKDIIEAFIDNHYLDFPHVKGYAWKYFNRMLEALENKREIFSDETLKLWDELKQDIENNARNDQGNTVYDIPIELFDLIKADQDKKGETLKKIRKNKRIFN